MEGYRFTLPYIVRVADVNYGGHAANSAVLNFFQDARIAYLARIGPYDELDIGEGCGIILPEAHVRYLAEMFLGDRLEIGVKVEEVRNSSFVMRYRIERDGEVSGEGTTSLVCFDYRARKARRLPKTFRSALLDFEGSEGMVNGAGGPDSF
ncbi:thioesterase family protein [uncultured Desulfuromonas sp.]|uniref:acyl-CoA thioesterase n=1 Tax=uncultured Desulfuromonas sp. TaxID=181013 RepID=UPI002615118B|nr:thioesterase family protein [uncultured Desulfuromonas sp.]